MALEITTLQKQAEGAFYVSDKRLCLTANDEVCDQDDPRAVSLLVGVGGWIPKDRARELGLLVEENEKARKPKEDKQLAPDGDKSAAKSTKQE